MLEDRYLRKYRNPSGYNYAVCLKEDNIPIGYINVSMEDSHDFGYGLRREFWQRGIATEAGLAVIAQLKKDGIPYITATHDVNNPRSGNVMKRLGMNYRYSYILTGMRRESENGFPALFFCPEMQSCLQNVAGDAGDGFRR